MSQVYDRFQTGYLNNNIAEGEPTYPDTVTISSTGVSADSQSASMGVFIKTYQIHSGRPVWKSTGRDDRFLYYNGNNLNQLYLEYLVLLVLILR